MRVTATPGGSLDFDVSGTAGLYAYLFVSGYRGLTCGSRYGPLLVDLSGIWLLWPWGLVPDTRSVPLDSGLVTPLPLALQVLAVDGASGSGNTSNLVEVVIE